MLEIEVSARLGAFTVDARLSCETDGIVAFFGRSGAGKTSLVNILAGLVKPDRGRIAVNGNVLFDSAQGIDLAPERRRLGYVFQEGRLFPHLSVRGNLMYGHARAPKAELSLGLDQVVDLLGLAPLLGRRPRELSGGEKQRVALGRALLANPRLLLMDEPLAALDQQRKDEVLPFIERLRDELGTPIIYVSHSMAEIVRLADTLVLISDGRVEAVGTVEDLTSRLELRPLTGRYEAGAVIPARIAGQDQDYALTELAFSGGRLRVPHVNAPLGTELRVRIRARDVSLALEPPKNISILNMIKCEIQDVGEEDGSQVDLRLNAGGTAIWARVTRRSIAEMGLRRGAHVYALVKAVAIDRSSLGRAAGTRRFLAGSTAREPD